MNTTRPTRSSTGSCDCGVPKSSVCLCKQLSQPSDQTRARTLWLGSVEENENEADIAKFFAPLASNEKSLPEIIIRRNRWTNAADGRRLGFALIRFDNEAEARKVLTAYHGATCTSSSDRPLRAHRWEKPFNNTSGTCTGSASTTALAFLQDACAHIRHPSEGKGMPQLEAQLEPLTETQLRSRLAMLGYPSCTEDESNAMVSGGRLAKKALLKRSLAGIYRSGKAARRLRFARGVPIPEPHLGTMLEALKSLQWRAGGRGRGRKGVDAEQYLVLGRASAEQPRAKAVMIAPQHIQVWNAATALLAAMLGVCKDGDNTGSGGCDLYKPTSLVVARNFKGSPHVDGRDVTWQYAAAFGDYGLNVSPNNEPESTCNAATSHDNGDGEGSPLRGGELCVESEAPGGAEVVLIDTRNRLARVDGRYCHWVREYDSGCRYSVIWYRADGPRTEPRRAVFDALL